ncbi:MAG: Hydrogen dehydrogenase [Proteobacteria bacterium]|nr:Hydrogen dehydrogenase [Pseudomonadota bacterium]
MAKTVTLKISGAELTASEGTTILDLARDNGFFIPTLCHFKGLSAVGACRLCLVEIRGVPRLLAACATRVAEGMDISIDSSRLTKYRQMIVELLLAERNHVCAVCVANGHCELQSLAQRLGVTHTRYPYRYPRFKFDASHPRFNYDPNRCILCTRCLRACEEVEGARTWNVMGRGINSRLGCDLDQPWGRALSCTSCGKCVQVCPTGALSEKGCAVGERTVRQNVLPFLNMMRHSGR